MLLSKRDAQNSMDLASYEMHSWQSRAVEKLSAVCARLTLVETWGVGRVRGSKRGELDGQETFRRRRIAHA